MIRSDKPTNKQNYAKTSKNTNSSSSFHSILPSPGASAQRSLAPSQDFSMCQNASLVLHSCSPGLTSSRLPPLSFDQSHFSCQGDPALVDAFVGLNPQQEKHQFQIDILPVTFFLQFQNNIPSSENGGWDASCGPLPDKPGHEKVCSVNHRTPKVELYP